MCVYIYSFCFKSFELIIRHFITHLYPLSFFFLLYFFQHDLISLTILSTSVNIYIVSWQILSQSACLIDRQTILKSILVRLVVTIVYISSQFAIIIFAFVSNGLLASPIRPIEEEGH